MVDRQPPEPPMILPESVPHPVEAETEPEPNEPENRQEDELVDEFGEDPLIPVSDLISTMTQFLSQVGDPETGQVLTVEQLSFDLPIELRLERDEEGRIVLNTAPPTQQIETTFMPVFHQIRPIQI